MEEKIAPSYPYREFLRDLWGYIRPYKGRFFLATTFRVIGDLSALYPAYVFAFIVSFFSTWNQGESLQPIWTSLIIWCVLSLTHVVGHWAGRYMGFVLAEQVSTEAFSAGVSHLASLDTTWHEHEGAGIKLKRVQRGRDAIDRLIRIWYANILETIIMASGTLIIIFRTDQLTGFFFAIFIITYSTIGISFARKTVDASHHEGAQEERVQNTSFEIIGNIRTVRSLGIGNYLLSLLRADVTELYSRITKRIFWFRAQAASLSAWFRYYKIACFAFIAYGISQGRFELGFLVLFNAYFNRVTDVSEKLSDITQDFVIAKNNLWRLQETLNFKSRPGMTAPNSFPSRWNELLIANVGFAYHTGQPVLTDVNLTVRRGERIGIVGSSGAGKSTLFKLLLKEYDGFNGSIQIDNLPIQSIAEETYFKKVGVVLQDTEVFNLSLRENIIISNPDAKDDKTLFDHAVTVSHVADFVHKLPQGYETVIGEKGFKLSGGERQRLGIARAIFKQPDILLLDEATSHLDIESEEKIRDSLHRVFEQITAIVIAHRLTTIKEMDRILVLEGGKITEEGTFDELQALRGRFADLWEKQKL